MLALRGLSPAAVLLGLAPVYPEAARKSTAALAAARWVNEVLYGSATASDPLALGLLLPLLLAAFSPAV